MEISNKVIKAEDIKVCVDNYGTNKADYRLIATLFSDFPVYEKITIFGEGVNPSDIGASMGSKGGKRGRS